MATTQQPNGGALPAQPQFAQVPPGQLAQPGQIPVPPGVTIVQQGQPVAYGHESLPPVPQPPVHPQQTAIPTQASQMQQAPQPPQVQQPAPVQIGAQTVLDGPEVPQELRGKTMGEFMAIYRGLSRLHTGGSPVPQPGPVPTQPAQQPTPQQPAHQTPIPTQGQAMTATEFFRDPAAAIRNAVNEVVGQQLAPVRQQALITEVQAARVAAAQQIGVENFTRLEPVIRELLANADAQSLANPQMWMIAAQTAAGRLSLAQQIGGQQPGTPGAPQVSAPSVQAHTPAGAYPAQFLGPQGQPIPNVTSFFTEQPGQAGAPTGAAAQLRPDQREAARLMDMTDEQYLAWSGGIQRSNGR